MDVLLTDIRELSERPGRILELFPAIEANCRIGRAWGPPVISAVDCIVLRHRLSCFASNAVLNPQNLFMIFDKP
jgi:hypothetical protein